MTINRMIDKNGKVLRCRVRVQRGSEIINKSFSTEIKARRFLLKFNHDNPSGQPAWRGRGIRVRDTEVKGTYRAKGLTPETMRINGCVLERSMGRCLPLDDCKHYLSCLDAADQAGWEGWRVANA